MEEGSGGITKILIEDSNPAAHVGLRVVLTVIASVAVLVLDVVTPMGLAAWLFQIVLVWIATFWASRRQLLALSVMCATFMVLGLGLSSIKDRHLTWIAWSNLLFGIGIVWALTHSSLRQRAAEDVRRKTAHELKQSQDTVRVLSGLLPICGWCKKIRTEAGTWEQLEVYISNHSQAEFTHSICQECAVRVDMQ